MTLPPIPKPLQARARGPDAMLAQYRGFIDLTDQTDAWRIVPVRPPVCAVDGAVIPIETLFGDAAPPHVRLGRAIQNLLQVVEVRDCLFDPLAGSLFELHPRPDLVRAGRSTPASAVLAHSVDVIERGLLAATRSFQNYYHWMVETLPRTMRLAADFPGETLLSHKIKFPFHQQIGEFATVDLPLEPLEGLVYLDHAITTTITTNFAGNPQLGRHTLVPDDVLAFSRAIASEIAGRTRRVFISRRDAATRVLNDELALIRELEARGFECPVMSDLSLRDQAELCGNAEIIVSTHGAGLSNALFRADRPCKIVEVVPIRRWPDNNLVCFYNLSQVAGFEHHLYDCAYPNEGERLLSQNWSIDHRQFLRFIDTLVD